MRVLGVGYCTLDFIGEVDRFAEPDSKVEWDKLSVQGGGAAATAMVALARWGVDVSFVGKVGADARGDEIVATLAGEGIDVGGVVYQEGAISQVTFVVIESATGQKRTYFTMGTVDPLEVGEVHDGLLDGVDVLHVDGTSPEAQLALVRAARERGVLTVLDAERVSDGVVELVGASELVVASERFASQFTGQGSLQGMCKALMERGPKVVVVTMGDEGAVAMGEDGVMVRAPAYPVEVVDNTGAGDVFHGAFIHAYTQERELSECLRFGCAAAGVSCLGLGGRERIPELDEIDELLEQGW
jgi:sugar/nucleoside kinase (ribokinase family)